MNNEIKVSLTIVVPGATMYSKQECLKNPKECTDFNQISVFDPFTCKKEAVRFFTRKNKPARHSLKLNKETYNHMINTAECPEWEKKGSWMQYSKEKRLNSHLKRICENFQGISYSYEIFED